MRTENKEYDLFRTFTWFKGESNGIVETMSDENEYMQITTKYSKVVDLELFRSNESLDAIKEEFDEEMENDYKMIPHHPQILHAIDHKISINVEERKIKYELYYNEPRLIPLAQYFYINKDSPSKIINCFYKIGCLFEELSEIAMIKLSLQNIYLNGKEEIVLILPPFKFFNDEIKTNINDPNLSIILPPEKQNEMIPEKYYSFVLGICILRALESNLFVKAYKKIFQNNYKPQMDQTPDFKKIFSESKRQKLFTDNVMKLIQECICDFLTRSTIQGVLLKIGKVRGGDAESKKNKKTHFSEYLIIPHNYSDFFSFIQKNNFYSKELNKSIASTASTEPTKVSNKIFIDMYKSINSLVNNKMVTQSSSLENNNYRTMEFEMSKSLSIEKLSQSMSVDNKSECVSIIGNNSLRYERENLNSFADSHSIKRNELNSSIYSNNSEFVYIPELEQKEIIQIAKEALNLNEGQINNDEDSENQRFEKIFKGSSPSIQILALIKYVKETYEENLTSIKEEIIKLREFQEEMNPKILEIFKRMQNIAGIKNSELKQFEDPNILPKPTDLYFNIMNKLNRLNASPIILKSLSNIFYIDVRELDLTDSNNELKAFEEIIKINSLFTYIIINQYNFTRLAYEGRTENIYDDVQKEIYEKIKKQEGFIQFIFDHVPIEKHLVPILSKSIMNKKKLEMFSIMKSNIDQEQMPILLESLKTCENLKFLNLSANNLKNSVTNLNNTLIALTFIEVVALNYCQIGTEGIISMLNTLKNKHFLKDLYLSGNEIGDEGIKKMKNQFSSELNGLRALSLICNDITDKAAENLSYFLKLKSQLQYFRIGNNKIRAIGVSHIISVLIGNCQLNDLDVGENEIGDEGCQHLEKYLEKYHNLSFFNIKKNEISEKRIIAILNILKNQLTNCKINVYGNKAKDENIQKYFHDSVSSPAKK